MDQDRAVALTAAVAFHESVGDLALMLGEDAGATVLRGQAAVRITAETFLAWLRGPASIHLLAGVVLDQSTGLPTGTPTSQGGTVQIHDDEEFPLALDFKDAKGFETADADPVVWTSTDETVIPVSASEDGHTFTAVAGVPGSTVVAATITLASGRVLTATEAIDVVPAGVETVSFVAGPVTKQPAPAA